MITSLQNPLVKQAVKLREQKKTRDQEQKVLITGSALISELAQDFTPTTLYHLPDIFPPSKCSNPLAVSIEVLKKITGQQSPDGLAAEFKRPQPNYSQLKRLLVLDRIQDPSNMGTLIRTTLALGWDAIFLLPHCNDPFSEKALRSAKGATFYLPIINGSYDDLLQLANKENITPYVAHTTGIPPNQITPQSPLLLILGNESQGPLQELLEFAQAVRIPMHKKSNSLNVAQAGSILMYLFGEIDG